MESWESFANKRLEKLSGSPRREQTNILGAPGSLVGMQGAGPTPRVSYSVGLVSKRSPGANDAAAPRLTL